MTTDDFKYYRNVYLSSHRGRLFKRVKLSPDFFGFFFGLTSRDYWRNRGWGTPAETLRKVRLLFKRGVYKDPKIIPGAFEALKVIKAMPDTELVIVTARSEDARLESEEYLERHYPRSE